MKRKSVQNIGSLNHLDEMEVLQKKPKIIQEELDNEKTKKKTMQQNIQQWIQLIGSIYNFKNFGYDQNKGMLFTNCQECQGTGNKSRHKIEPFKIYFCNSCNGICQEPCSQCDGSKFFYFENSDEHKIRNAKNRIIQGKILYYIGLKLKALIYEFKMKATIYQFLIRKGYRGYKISDMLNILGIQQIKVQKFYLRQQIALEQLDKNTKKKTFNTFTQGGQLSVLQPNISRHFISEFGFSAPIFTVYRASFGIAEIPRDIEKSKFCDWKVFIMGDCLDIKDRFMSDSVYHRFGITNSFNLKCIINPYQGTINFQYTDLSQGLHIEYINAVDFEKEARYQPICILQNYNSQIDIVNFPLMEQDIDENNQSYSSDFFN